MKVLRRQAVLWLAVLMVVAAGLAASRIDFAELWIDIFNWVEGLDDLAGLVFVAIYIAVTIGFLPLTILDLGAGALFGVVQGSLLVSIGALIGASVSFLITRYLLRGWILSRFGQDGRFLRIDHAIERHGWKVVGLSRLSPLFPFWLLNYIFGLTRVPFHHFVIATWFGMLPLVVTYVYIGSLAVDLATIGSLERSPAEWAVYAAGFVTTAMLTLGIARWGRAVLEKDLDEA